ncbi:hypothetical protein CJ030_MR1G006293 [Morella rubra]|uniref:Uncharacterized protein n=1 Tax=Morella rubra TaxID=262757 RepID=A0A6A1WRU3_9ROSI|nr:hypothetical protein CJ030_MR1G006294 [Morella rubra]KAB1227377.1 hypothetical protein CJ030_MR1G006293 [Morella rubra]
MDTGCGGPAYPKHCSEGFHAERQTAYVESVDTLWDELEDTDGSSGSSGEECYDRENFMGHHANSSGDDATVSRTSCNQRAQCMSGLFFDLFCSASSTWRGVRLLSLALMLSWAIMSNG